jgi:hypothetical protein
MTATASTPGPLEADDIANAIDVVRAGLTVQVSVVRTHRVAVVRCGRDAGKKIN